MCKNYSKQVIKLLTPAGFYTSLPVMAVAD